MANKFGAVFNRIGLGGPLHIAELMVYRHQFDFSVLSEEREQETCPETGRSVCLMPTLKEAFNAVLSAVLDKEALDVLSGSIGQHEKMLMEDIGKPLAHENVGIVRILTQEERKIALLVENLDVLLLFPQNNEAIFNILDREISSLSDVRMKEIEIGLFYLKDKGENSALSNADILKLKPVLKEKLEGIMSDFHESNNGSHWLRVSPDPNLSEKIKKTMAAPFKPYLQ